MKKTLAVFIMMSLLCVSCGGPSGSKNGESSQTVASATGDNTDTSTEPDSNPTDESTLPELAHSFSTNVTMVNFTEAQAEKYSKAIEIVKLVIATEAFRNQILNYTYNGAKQFAN